MVNVGKYTNPMDPVGLKTHPNSPNHANLHPKLTEDEEDVFVHVHPNLMKHSGIKMSQLSTLPMSNSCYFFTFSFIVGFVEHHRLDQAEWKDPEWIDMLN